MRPNICQFTLISRLILFSLTTLRRLRRHIILRQNKSTYWAKSVLIILVILFIFIFVIFPITFKLSLKLKQLLVFTNVNLPSAEKYFEHYNLTAYRNLYIPVRDQQSDKIIFLGVWHILPRKLINDSMAQNFTYDKALMYSNISVLLYFHGSGQARSYFKGKYNYFREYFHVIAFDYRDFADSSSAELLEDLIVEDCLQLYKWVRTRTKSQIFIWGHSLGSALSAKTVSLMKHQPQGLILEAPFTRLREELYVHPVGKFFAWLPWFKSTIIDPLEKAGFVFDTTEYISNLTLPIMIVNSKTDNMVAYKFGVDLFETISALNKSRHVIYYQFPIYLDYEHNYMYDDPSYSFIIGYFKHMVCNLDTSASSEDFY